MPIRVAVDAMGGDLTPRVPVRGSLQALEDEPDLEIVLVGDSARIRSELEAAAGVGELARVEIVHASQVVGMNEAPVEALRSKQDSSLVRMAELGASGAVDAVLSAGHTGACAAVCQLTMKPLPCVKRPGLAVTIPSFHRPFVLCDVGANIQAKPRHLYEYAVMASLYAERVVGVVHPRVALVSTGEESTKGTELVRQAHELLERDDQVNFVGNVEGRELFEDRCDVAVCDGFVGNIILKLVEGLAQGLVRTIAREYDPADASESQAFHDALQRVWDRHDYRRYGGVPLLGVDGVCVVCHGRSSELAVRNAVRVARRFVLLGLNDAIVARLG